MPNEIKPGPFCWGNAKEAFLKRKKLFASMRFPTIRTMYTYGVRLAVQQVNSVGQLRT